MLCDRPLGSMIRFSISTLIRRWKIRFVLNTKRISHCGATHRPRRFQRRLISRQKLAELISPLYRALPVFNFREMQTIFFFLPFFPSATLNCANIRQWRMLFRRGCRFVEFPHFPRLIKSLNRGDIVIFILLERNEDEWGFFRRLIGYDLLPPVVNLYYV